MGITKAKSAPMSSVGQGHEMTKALDRPAIEIKYQTAY
jgi:hypothetical protein